MYRRPPLLGRPVLEGKKVLLIDNNQATREVRVSVLRSHGVEVEAAADFSSARIAPTTSSLRLDIPRRPQTLSGEALQFYKQIKDVSPGQPFGFLVGPPVYLSLTWPREVTLDDAPRGQWAETVRHFATAA